MRIPAVAGVIDRRILVNYRIDPMVAARFLPEPFQPLLVGGWSIGGICLIRLKNIRPAFFPFQWGIGSENAAHRFAVKWQTPAGEKQGVYIPRRDTNSLLNSLVGGRIFPGVHHYTKFSVKESDHRFQVRVEAKDRIGSLQLEAVKATALPKDSVFKSVAEASEFFEAGSLGYSDSRRAGRFDGLELKSFSWSVKLLKVKQVRSGFFESGNLFPGGSYHFDSALLMTGIDHQWHSREELCCPKVAFDSK